MVACFKGFYEIVRLLLDKKADVSKPNSMDQMPILFCFSRLEENYYKYENKKICMMMIDLLLSKGADVNIRVDKKYGYTVLMKLASADITDRDKLVNTLDIINFLLDRGADVYVTGLDHKTVFDAIKPTEYRDEILYALKNTKQTIFYESEKRENSTSTRPKKNSITSNIVLEANIMKLNCCHICIYLLILV